MAKLLVLGLISGTKDQGKNYITIGTLLVHHVLSNRLLTPITFNVPDDAIKIKINVHSTEIDRE